MSSEVDQKGHHIEPCPFCGGTVELTSSKTLGDRLFCFKCPDTSPCVGSGLGIYVVAGQVETAIAAWNRRSASPSIGRVKPLEWSGAFAHTGVGIYFYLREEAGGFVLERHEGVSTIHSFFDTEEDAKARAQSKFEEAILSTLVYHEEPAGDTQGAGDAEPTWRDLALQFDGHRIEALSLLRYVSESSNCHEATNRAHEVKAFLSKPPLSGEAVLAARIAALASGYQKPEEAADHLATDAARAVIELFAAPLSGGGRRT